MRRGCEKRISTARVGGRGGVPGEALESAKMKESTESAKRLERPVPCKQGAADIHAPKFKGFASCRRSLE